MSRSDALDSAPRRQLDLELELRALRMPDGVPEAFEQPQRVGVLGEHQRGEPLDSLLVRTLDQALEQVARPRPRFCQSSATTIAHSATFSLTRTNRATPTASSSSPWSSATSASWSWWSTAVRYESCSSLSSFSGVWKRR